LICFRFFYSLGLGFSARGKISLLMWKRKFKLVHVSLRRRDARIKNHCHAIENGIESHMLWYRRCDAAVKWTFYAIHGFKLEAGFISHVRSSRHMMQSEAKTRLHVLTNLLTVLGKLYYSNRNYVVRETMVRHISVFASLRKPYHIAWQTISHNLGWTLNADCPDAQA